MAAVLTLHSDEELRRVISLFVLERPHRLSMAPFKCVSSFALLISLLQNSFKVWSPMHSRF